MNMFNFWFKTQLYHPYTYVFYEVIGKIVYFIHLIPFCNVFILFVVIITDNHFTSFPRKILGSCTIATSYSDRPTDRFAAIFNGARFRLRRYRSIRLFSNELASEICDSFWNQHLLFVLSQMCICQFDLKYMLQSLNIIKWFVYSDDMVDVALEMEQQAKRAAQFSEAHAANFSTLSTL